MVNTNYTRSNINNNINITNIKLKDFSISESGKALVFSFKYTSVYNMAEPRTGVFGAINFVGDVIF